MPRVRAGSQPALPVEQDSGDLADQAEAAELQRARVEAAFEPGKDVESDDIAETSEVEAAVSAPARRGRVREAKGAVVTGTTGAGGASSSMFFAVSEEDERSKILMYGREGSRKTTSALLATQGGRVLVVNAEGGLKLRALAKHGVKTENVVVWPDPRSGEQVTARGLEALHEAVLSGFHDDPNFLYAVVVDSWSEAFGVMRDQAQEKRVQTGVRKLQAAGKQKEAAEIDVDFVDRDDYGVATNQARKILRRFRDLPCHVIFTALEKYEEKEDAYVPAVSPAIRTDLLGMVDQVLYFRVAPTEEGEDAELAWRALTVEGSGGSTRGKDRDCVLPRVLVQPTFTRILGYVQGELLEESDPLQQGYLQARAEKEAEAKRKEEAKEEAKAAVAKKPAARRSRAATPAA